MDTNEKELIVTKIEVQKKDPKRRSIFLNETFYIGVHGKVIEKLQIEKGVLWTETLEEQVNCEELYMKGLKKGLDLIYRSSKTEKQLAQKLLEREYPEEVVDRVVTKLVEEGFLNDLIFAEQFLETRSQKYGAYRLRQELKLKGVSENVIDKAFENTEQESEFDRALIIGKKRALQYAGDPKEKAYQKMTSYLSRKGFSYDIVKKVTQELGLRN